MQHLARFSIGPASALAALLGGIIALYIPGVIGLSIMIDKPAFGFIGFGGAVFTRRCDQSHPLRRDNARDLYRTPADGIGKITPVSAGCGCANGREPTPKGHCALIAALQKQGAAQAACSGNGSQPDLPCALAQTNRMAPRKRAAFDIAPRRI